MSTPRSRALRASDVNVRTTPLTCGCQASVATSTRIRIPAAQRATHAKSGHCDQSCGSAQVRYIDCSRRAGVRIMCDNNTNSCFRFMTVDGRATMRTRNAHPRFGAAWVKNSMSRLSFAKPATGDKPISDQHAPVAQPHFSIYDPIGRLGPVAARLNKAIGRKCGMRRSIFSAALIGAFVLVATVARSEVGAPLTQAPAEQAGMSAKKLERLREVLKSDIDQGKLPGAVVMVARKGKLVYADALGFQDKAEGKAMGVDAVFRIYSMTKPLVSVAAMMLVEDGKIQLTDPVSKFLPAFKSQRVSVARTDGEFARVTYTNVAADREITVQDLMRHTAGLAYGEITLNAPVKEAYTKAGIYLPGVRDYDSRDMTPAEQVERAAAAPLAHQPGTVWEYSIASDILGRVVEAASGKRLGDFLDERLFKPLRMVDTAFAVPADKAARVAQPLPVDLASGQPIKVIDVSALPKNDSGGAGAVSTAADYLRFSQMLLNGGELDGVRILSRTTVALMTSDHLGTRIAVPFTPGELLLGTPGYTFGLGFAVRQGAGVAGVHGSAGEFMWGGYAGTYFWVDPKEQIAAVYMSQAPSPIRAYYRRLMKQLVYQAIVD